MRSVFFLLSLFSYALLCADISTYFRKEIGERESEKQIRNIDYIYLINLDQRPEKWTECQKQLARYGITPHRFPGIYGWELSESAFLQLGVKFLPGMEAGRWVADGSDQFQREFLREESYGKVVFCPSMTPGAIGCTLSHLSILQDAYEKGYETIWIMEDDIEIKQDPKQLEGLIDKLSALVGENGWDVLYTDMDLDDRYFENFITPMCIEDNDYISDIKGDLRYFWRPDMQLDHKLLAKRTRIGEDFLQIGARSRTHSMIIRRSGMKKILDHEKTNRIFLAYDQEIATVKDIRLFNIISDVVSFRKSPSDTEKKQFQNTFWEEYKKETLDKVNMIPGWTARAQAEKLMEFIRKKKPQNCVEIGAFGGATTYQIARTLSFLNKGIVHAIDAWDGKAAVEGIKGKKTIEWWMGLNMKVLKEQFLSLFTNTPLEKYCRPIHQTSKDAVHLFQNESIDLLYIDGNDSEAGNVETVTLYLPKVKEGGYICLNAAFSPNKNQAIAILMKECRWIKEGPTEDCLFFQKRAKLF